MSNSTFHIPLAVIEAATMAIYEVEKREEGQRGCTEHAADAAIQSALKAWGAVEEDRDLFLAHRRITTPWTLVEDRVHE